MSGMLKGHFKYLAGFGNHHASEAVPGALPIHQNSPQVCAYDLYAEQLNGTAFTAPRSNNQRSWLYRILPTARHEPMQPYTGNPLWLSDADECGVVNPNQLRWNPLPLCTSDKQVDFADGIVTYASGGSVVFKTGCAVHLYRCNASMQNRALCNADADFLIVPEKGTLTIQTEFGWMEVGSGEIGVIQRGIRFRVEVSESCRGYILELFQGHFRIPDLGPIGANGLANPRDFYSPIAAFDKEFNVEYTILQRFGGKLFSFKQAHSPFDVVAYHGNYVPYKYDLANFCPVNAVSFDHPDPSIFTVLTAPTGDAGVAACDFVIFPPRWMVTEHTFRPPWYHRNCMTEFMGLIRGVYEAKEKGFLPGGGSLHSCMIPHGPEAEVFEKCSTQELVPAKIPDSSLAFMFESTFIFKLSPHGNDPALLDADYMRCWKDLKPKALASLPTHGHDDTFHCQ